MTISNKMINNVLEELEERYSINLNIVRGNKKFYPTIKERMKFEKETDIENYTDNFKDVLFELVEDEACEISKQLRQRSTTVRTQ